MKKIRKIITNFKTRLDDKFEDPFIVKRDHTNIVVLKYHYLIDKLDRKLWYD